MLKVLHIVYGDTGGAARIVLDIARHHDRKHFEPAVILVGYQVDPHYIRELEEIGIDVQTATKGKKWDWRFFCKLRKIIATFRPDILLLHTPVAYFWGRLAGFGLGIKLIISVEHLAMANYYGRLGRVVNFLQTHFLTNKVICVSEDVKSVVKKELRLSENKLKVIENGIPVNRYQQLDTDSILSGNIARIKMISRLDSQKDPATLIRAVKDLQEKGFNIRLDMVGDGNLRPEMEKLKDQLGLSKHVFFLGMRNDIEQLLLSTDIFVLSTHREGLPIALLEAMSVGLPCIATAVPGNIGVIEDKKSGLLVPENDVTAMADAIALLINNSGMAKQIAQNARIRLAKKYSILRTVREYENLFLVSLNASGRN